MRLSDIMSQMELSQYAEVGLVIFLGVFVLIAARIFNKQRAGEYEAARQMPLDDDVIRTPFTTREEEGGAR